MNPYSDLCYYPEQTVAEKPRALPTFPLESVAPTDTPPIVSDDEYNDSINPYSDLAIYVTSTY